MPSSKPSADGILQKGVILRHLALPGHVEDSFAVLDQMAAWNDADPGCFLPSVMSQYTPFYKAASNTGCPACAIMASMAGFACAK